jgi:iron only hydrogenase large subunit-like protein
MRQVLRRIQRFATKSLGFEHVFDTTFARHISLLEHAYEFNQRKTSSNLDPEQQQLPMLASACPGWICYAEKTHPEMIPFISRTRSPQQIMGTLVKEWLAKRWEKRSDMADIRLAYR